jgi:hypothetical protein
MKCNLPISLDRLKPSDRKRLLAGLQEAENRDMAIMLRQYTQMVCCVLSDGGMTEDELLCFLGSFRQFFRRQAKLVKAGTQQDELDRRMKEIFPSSGFPDDFFKTILSDWEGKT